MAGGMSRRVPARRSRRPPSRHCWVYGPPDADGRPSGPWPAVLLEWRQHGPEWQGFVVYVVVEAAHAVGVQTWVDARYLRPVINPDPAPPI